MMTLLDADLSFARLKIADAEESLGRWLSNGERRDLLADNTRWSLAYIKAVVDEINLGDAEEIK